MARRLKLGNPEMTIPATISGWKDRRSEQDLTVAQVGIGDLLGGTYRLTRPIRRGGMGEVFLATHERLPMELAVKVMSPSLLGDDGDAQFRREAAALARLHHPNIVQLIDFNWTPDGLPYLVMEHLPGTDLAELLTRQPRLAAEQIASILHQAAAGLDAAHRVGIAHLDLKPSNMMVATYEGRGSLIKLIDFGIAMMYRPNPSQWGYPMGTPEFMSPEQIEDRPERVGYASDQFALAVIAYLLLTGTLPWRGQGDELVRAIVRAQPQPMPVDEHHDAVEAVLRRGLARSPEQRFPSTVDFVRALGRAMIRDGYLPAPRNVTPLLTTPTEDAASAPRDARRRSASLHRRTRRLRYVLVGAALIASLGFVAEPARGDAVEAWHTLRGYAVHAVAQGRSWLAAARRLGRFGP